MFEDYGLFHVHSSEPGSRYRPTRPGEVTLHDRDGFAHTYTLSGFGRGVVSDWRAWAAGVFGGQIVGKYPVFSVESEDTMNTEHARHQAEAQMEHIRQLMDWHSHANKCESSRKCDHNLEAATDYGLTFNESFDVDTVTQAINETPLSVEVRGGWLPVGTYEPDRPTDYRILLRTVGGIAVRVTGWLDGSGNPETARLEYQDWFIPWSVYTDYDYDLLEFARMFYYHS